MHVCMYVCMYARIHTYIHIAPRLCFAELELHMYGCDSVPSHLYEKIYMNCAHAHAHAIFIHPAKEPPAT